MSGIDMNTREYDTLAKLVATMAVSVGLVIGTCAMSWSAENHGGHQGGGGQGVGHQGVGHRGVGHQGGGHWGGGRGYGGGYYAAPPVIYGSPYCDTPPVLFIPFVGANQPCY